jgi:hypothetical protein
VVAGGVIPIRCTTCAATEDSFAFNGQYTGSALTDLLLGLPQAAGLTSLTIPHVFNDTVSWFIQDTYQVAPRLTVNYGLRYEYTTPRIERDNRVTNFDPDARGGRGALVTAPTGIEDTAERSLVEPWRKGFAPRIGIAYKITDKLVFRGGGGFFYQAFDRQGSESLLELNPPFLIDTRQFLPPNVATPFLLKDGFPANTLTPFPLDDYTRVRQLMIRAVNRKLRPAYVENFSAGFQYAFHADLILDIAYVGNFGHRQWSLGNLNQGILNREGLPPTFPYPDFGQIEFKDSIGNLNYNSLQMKVEKRWSSGMGFLVSYTFSKTIADYVSNLDIAPAGPGNGRIFYQNYHDRKADKALAINDTPNRLVASFSCEVPADRGHPLFNSGMANHVFGGWQINGIYTYASGQSLGITSPFDSSGTNPIKFPLTRADCIAKPQFTSGGSVTEWFDTSAFAIPALFHCGTCSGTPGIRSDSGSNFDFPCSRNFCVHPTAAFDCNFVRSFLTSSTKPSLLLPRF